MLACSSEVLVKTIRAIKEMRLLAKGGGVNLHQTGVSLPSGAEFEVGEPEVCGFDHDKLPALPVIYVPDELAPSGRQYYILERDIDPNYWMRMGVEVPRQTN